MFLFSFVSSGQLAGEGSEELTSNIRICWYAEGGREEVRTSLPEDSERRAYQLTLRSVYQASQLACSLARWKFRGQVNTSLLVTPFYNSPSPGAAPCDSTHRRAGTRT